MGVKSISERGIKMRKRICCVIIACVMCLTPSALLQAQGEEIAPCSNSWCEDGMHMGYLTDEVVSKKLDYDSSGHWYIDTHIVRCRNCGIKLETTDQAKTKQPHDIKLGQCTVCHYFPK